VSAPQPLTGDELATIKARAERATPGPWEADLGSVWRPSPLSVTEIVCDCRGGEHITTREDAEHIAGMDPETTLRLVAEVERLRAWQRTISDALDLTEIHPGYTPAVPDATPSLVAHLRDTVTRSLYHAECERVEWEEAAARGEV
jgi:hypothetical protein